MYFYTMFIVKYVSTEYTEKRAAAEEKHAEPKQQTNKVVSGADNCAELPEEDIHF